MGTKGYWLQIERQRISRRRLLGATGAGAVGLAVVAACGGGKTTTAGKTPGATTETGTPKAGGRYIYAIEGDWGGIDPVTSVAYGPGVLPRMYNALLDRSRIKLDYTYFDLAESVEQPDDVTYNFKIRPGMKIAPNNLNIPERDLDSQDAKVWLDRITADARAVHKRFTNNWLDKYSAPDPQTFTMTTKGAYFYFYGTIGAPVGGCIPPREFFEQKVNLEDKGVGAGPYVLRPGTFSNTGGASFDRNPNYYRKDENNNNAQLPYIDGIDAVRISDRQPRRSAFLSKQIHSYGAETVQEVDQLKSQVAGLIVVEEPAYTFIAFTMNPTRKPWDDDRIRKAAMYALNRQQFVDVILGGAGKPDGLVHWSLGPYALDPSELEKLQPWDPAKSKQLIKDATGKDTIKIKVMYPVSNIEFHDKHLPIWRQQMQAAGFELDEEPLEFTNWIGRYAKVDYDSSLSLNQVYETPEIPLDFQQSTGPTADGSFALGVGKLYPEVDKAIKDSKSTTDAKDQIERVKDTQRLIYEKGPTFLPIMTWTDFTAYHPFVKNIPQGIGGTGLYLNTWWLDL